MIQETFNEYNFEQADNEDGFILLSETEKTKTLEEIQAEALQFLNNTDWLVIRHQDQINAGAETSLNQEQYLELFQQRQIARSLI